MVTNSKTLNDVKKKLSNKENRHKPRVDDNWWEAVDQKPGVYAIFRKGRYSRPVYVGETSSLMERLRDLRNPKNHTFTSQIKKNELRGRRTLDRLRDYIENNFVVAYASVAFGRKEIEEQLISAWDTSKRDKHYDPKRFNKKNPRWSRAMASIGRK